ncbi:MAG TPA: O-antigen ligase family protein [Vicinamibacterales bacterium]|jgi:O-antigen ligase
MASSIALDAPRTVGDTKFDQIGLYAVFGVAAALQFSIAAAQILLALAFLCWVGALVVGRERFDVPGFFWPLACYAGATLVSAAFSYDPRASLIDSKQLVLFLLVPITFRFVRGSRGLTLMTVVVTFGAVSAAFGIFQYGILHYDNLGQRPQGTLGHYMTYSGLLMLVIAIALARVLFERGERTWAALAIPALCVAVALSFSRSAQVGVCAAAAVLFALKDFRLFAIVPVVAAIFFAVAPGQISQRFVSMFNQKDPTRLDRVAMIHEGERMIAAHPLTGVGPNMVERLYSEYRGADAVNKINPHLHNVPVQIAAERGLPALAIWLWFIVATIRDVWQRFRSGQQVFLAAAALACITALLTAGLFEYNFGDSEVLMLFLIVITLPAAAAHAPVAVRPTA